jgi:hypothetical protein
LRKALGSAQRKAFGLEEKVGAEDLQSGSGRIDAATKNIGEFVTKGTEPLINQVKGIGAGAIGLLSGALLGGSLFGTMLYGVHDADRLRTQVGELVNTAISAGGTEAEKSIAWMAGFQEQLRVNYGIAPSGLQTIFQGYVNSGLALNDIFQQQSRSLGDVGHDAIVMSYAMDSSYKLGTGFTQRNATLEVQKFGMSLSDSIELLTKLESSAHHGGMGVSHFVDWAVSASMQVRTLGITTEEVAGAALEMHRQLTMEGKDEASTFATSSVGEAISGLSGMGTDREIWMAQGLGLGTGLEGRQNLKQGLSSGRSDLLLKISKMWRKEAMGAGAGDEMVARYYLERQGFGVQGSKVILRLGAMEEKGLALAGLDVGDKKFLREALMRQGAEKSSIQEKTAGMMQGLANIGKGIMLMLSAFLGYIVVTVKALPILEFGSDDEVRVVKAKQTEMFNHMSKGWSQVSQGGNQVWSGMKNIINPILGPLTRAFEPIGPGNASRPLTEAPPGYVPPSSGSMTPHMSVPRPSSIPEADTPPNEPSAPPTPKAGANEPHASLDPRHLTVHWGPGASTADKVTVRVEMYT